jgi:N utilization substance protein B
VKQADAREQALGALYAADSRGLDVIDITKVSQRAADLAEGTWQQREEIDLQIGAASTKWRVQRMPVVDRNILRLGVYELVNSDLSIAIIISEAVELAKKFSTARSGAFINGVLSGVVDADATFGTDDLTQEDESAAPNELAKESDISEE